MTKHLHVVTAITNPVRYKSRPALYRAFESYMHRFPNVTLWTAEAAFGDRDWEVTQEGHPNHLRLRTEHEIWHKENLLNLLINQLPADAEYVAWIDADVLFARDDWAAETIEQLQHYDVVQMFSECMDLDSLYGQAPSGERLPGMVACYQRGEHSKRKGPYERRTGHCGYAWAARRSALRKLGGLIDYSIVGSADFQMASALLGDITESVQYNASPGYLRKLVEWGERARTLRRNVGHVPGLLMHNWHGHKSQRGYNWRIKILVEHQYDPETDLVKDHQGLYKWSHMEDDRMIALRDSLRHYFRSRHEDKPSF